MKKNETKNNVPRVKEAFRLLNDCGALETKVNFASVKHADLEDLFMNTVIKVDQKLEELIPTSVVLLYNELLPEDGPEDGPADGPADGPENKPENKPKTVQEVIEEPAPKKTPRSIVRARIFKELIENKKMNKNEIAEAIQKEYGGTLHESKYQTTIYLAIANVFDLIDTDENGAITKKDD